MQMAFAPKVRTASLVLFALAAACVPALAQAQPPDDGATLQLRWDACYFDGGPGLRTFACATNSGSEVLVASATPSAALPQFNGCSGELFLEFPNQASVPSWWQVGTGYCRAAASLSAAFVPPAGSTACLDPYVGLASGGASYTVGYDGPNRSRLRFVCAITGTASLSAGQNLFLCRFSINHARTVGTGSCVGCASPAGIGFGRVQLTQPAGVGSPFIYYPEPGTDSDFVSWQEPLSFTREYAWSPSTGWHKSFTLVTPTPARRPSWGAIKAMYGR